MKRIILFLLLAVFITTLTGCWDAKELDMLSIVAGIGIDTAPQNGEYVFSVEIGKAQKTKSDKSGSGQDDPFLILSCTDKTMSLAMEQFRLKSSRELFLHPNQVVVFGKDLAKRGLIPILDMFTRDHESRLEVWVVVADGSAVDILNTKTKQEPITAAAIDRILQSLSHMSEFYVTKVFNMISRLESKGTALIIPMISRVEELNSTSLAFSGSALFQKDRMVGELTPDETLGYVFAMGSMHDGVLKVPMENGTVVLEISFLAASAKPVVTNGRITIELQVQAQFAVGELQGFKNQKIIELAPKIREAAQETVSQMIVQTFKKTQLLKTDIYGFGTSIYRNYPKEWKTMKDNWENIYPTVSLKLSVKAALTNVGFIGDSLEMQGGKS